jgi:hypothetical protein
VVKAALARAAFFCKDHAQLRVKKKNEPFQGLENQPDKRFHFGLQLERNPLLFEGIAGIVNSTFNEIQVRRPSGP